MTKLGRAIIMAINIKIDGTNFVLGTVGEKAMHGSDGKFLPQHVSATELSQDPSDFVVGSDLSSKLWLLPGQKITCGKNTLTCTAVGRHGEGVNVWEITADIYLDQFKKTYKFCFDVSGSTTTPIFTGITNLGAKPTSYLTGCYIFSYEKDDKLYIGCPTRVRDNFAFTSENQNANIWMSYTKKDGKWVPDQVPDISPKETQFPYTKCFFWFLLGGLSDSAGNPYEPGGSSGTGGGGGSFDNTSTPVNVPSLPTVSAAHTGFISLYNPTLNQLNELSSYMWSDLFQIEGWKKLFANPMDAILGLSIVPVAVPSGGTREVKVGNIGTGIQLTVASSQFVEVNCGSIDVKEYWGAYLDYEPYTQAQIFLPYIGIRPISVDEIMGKTVSVVYHVDILTGACCCFVKCGDSVLYTYNGQCSIPIPITGANYASVVNGVIGVASSVGSLVASGGSSAPTAIPGIASSIVNQMKPQIEKSGSISGSAGVLNMQTPYLILIRPRQALPIDQNKFIGYPSLITVKLTELSGYTEVQSIHLENIPATQEELAEIESLLEGGVIF